jgi:hypothetical protein
MDGWMDLLHLSMDNKWEREKKIEIGAQVKEKRKSSPPGGGLKLASL